MPTTDLLVSCGRPPPRGWLWWRVKEPEEVEEVWSAGWETMMAGGLASLEKRSVAAVGCSVGSQLGQVRNAGFRVRLVLNKIIFEFGATDPKV